MTAASLPAGAQGTATLQSNTVVLNGLWLAPGSTLHVSVTATAPTGCPASLPTWSSQAFEGKLGASN